MRDALGKTSMVLLAAFALATVVLLGRPRQPATQRIVDWTAPDSHSEAELKQHKSHGDEFRFLLAILTGVTLSVAVTVTLPSLPTADEGDSTLVIRMIMLVAGLAGVLLLYQNILYGSKFFVGPTESFHTAMLVVVTLIQSGMFVVVGNSQAADLVAHWFGLFAAFSYVTSLEMTVAYRQIKNSPPSEPPTSAVNMYLKSLRNDIYASVLTGSAAVVYLALSGATTGIGPFVAAALALTVMIGANVGQYVLRRRITRDWGLSLQHPL